MFTVITYLILSVYFSVFSFEISGVISPHVSMLLELMEIIAKVLTALFLQVLDLFCSTFLMYHQEFFFCMRSSDIKHCLCVFDR